ncbi:alpha/beta hydrolase [Mucilaginibacter daejeonensis]|uniref:alpha/beta hydrolase n=1 Tax=Mucilaginibacter daejeonensis TaxID=398049 RepID=UPI001D17A0C3|nr:alpha/beta hydrolase [Mucilaginibacter daejeonensis]UEG51729.1 alpha/beta hydrolase [Mucilaginibacter daejeonensis]
MKNLTTNPIKQGMSLLAIAAVSAFTACSNPSGSTTTTDSTSTTTKTTDTLVKTGAGTPDSVKPKGPKPMWAPEIEPQMQAVLEKLASYNDKPIPQLTAVEARKNHTPTDAVMDLMKQHNIPMPQMKVDTVGKEIPVSGGGNIHARIYIPSGASEPLPVIVYYHGGGYVIANIDVYDASAKALADQVQAVVVSVAYRLAPEHKFPIAHNDSFEAYQWVVKNASSIQGDPKRIAVAGESAGGNLAANMAIMARDKKIQAPLHVLSVYPIASADMNSTSYNKYKDAKPLNKPMMMWFAQQYTNNMSEAKDPRINLVGANLAGLPPFTIINAQLDPLASDGEMLTSKLKAAGVTVDHKVYNGVTHEFFGMGALVPGAKEAMTYAADQLKNALKK